MALCTRMLLLVIACKFSIRFKNFIIINQFDSTDVDLNRFFTYIIYSFHLLLLKGKLIFTFFRLHRIDENLQVKLADSALARDLFPEDYSCLGDSENRPIKWLALETLQKKIFSEASDAWAFGVLMWELSTLARQPYQEIPNDDMEVFLSDGFRLAQPPNVPDEM